LQELLLVTGVQTCALPILPQCLLPDWVRLGRRLGRLLRDHHHPDQRDALLERLRQQVLA
jgi:hypothetical protein